MKQKEKTCKYDCIANINGHCKLKIKDKPSEYSKIVLGSVCAFYRKSKSLFKED